MYFTLIEFNLIRSKLFNYVGQSRRAIQNEKQKINKIYPIPNCLIRFSEKHSSNKLDPFSFCISRQRVFVIPPNLTLISMNFS